MRRFVIALTLALPALAVAAEPTPDEKAVLKELEKYDHFDSDATVLRFGCHSDLPDSALAKMKKLPKLEELDFVSDKVTDAGLANLKEIKTLKTLQINSGTITDAGLDHIKDLPN